MSSDTELDVGPSCSRRAGNTPTARAVESLSECGDMVCMTEQHVRELVSSFEELEVNQFLPDGCVRLVAESLANDPNSLLSLLAMCGTCRQWRQVAAELGGEGTLSFDSMESQWAGMPLAQRFRKASPAVKETVFASAAQLFSGYTNASFSGDGVSDRVLQRAAQRVGDQLVKLRVSGSSFVTGAGLSTILSCATSVRHLHLDDLAKAAHGEFLSVLFERCQQLQTLHLSNMRFVNWAASKAASACWGMSNITKLHVRDVNLDSEFGLTILARMPRLLDLEIDGPARNITAAAINCPLLQRVSYLVSSRSHLDEALAALMQLRNLKTLELIIKNFILCPDQLRVIGMLPLVELRLDSYIYKQQPTLSRSSYSHVDNDGIKALVDSICNHWCTGGGEMQPLKLSVCGATALTHDAVSALLRLPILTELDIGGCCRIIAMDKMRLVAKVRAGREMLESGRRPALRNSRFPGLFL